jgi:hypothetical protein
MARIYRTAQGKSIDIDGLRLTNEETIAVGNMKVNARGDQLGAGGQVIQSRNQTMDQHYRVHTSNPPIAADNRTEEAIQRQRLAGASVGQGRVSSRAVVPPPPPAEPIPTVDPAGESFDPPGQDPTPQLRGTLADSIAKSVTVEQKNIQPTQAPTLPKRM